MMQLDRLTLGRMAKELGIVRDTLEKVCRLADVLKFMESDELLFCCNLTTMIPIQHLQKRTVSVKPIKQSQSKVVL